jgi:hypothetical protein
VKLDALDHPKTLDFAAKLGVSLPTALGHLELLWAFTGKQSPQGNIGKWPDGAIARACHWMEDPTFFLQSLLQSGLLDAHEDHRYVVHDWAEHAPRWVRAKLAKLKMDFVTTAAPTVEPTVERTKRPTSADCSGDSVSVGKGSEGKREEAGDGFQLTGGEPQKQVVAHANLPRDTWEEWLTVRRRKKWPCDVLTLQKQLDILAAHDTATQRDMINNSIQANWQGIFPPKGGRRQEAAGDPNQFIR